MSARALALAAALALALPAAVLAATYGGAAVEDPQMPVKVRVGKAGVVRLDYAEVAVTCSNGDELREPGAEHSATLDAGGRFSDTIEQELSGGALGRSWVKGRVHRRKAVGVLTYDLLYDGGECHSGKVRWKARRKGGLDQAAH